ncbi:nucleotidyltransferase domain-containing protein [Saccharopolyspora taberi]|uniref:Nucleotidyltransferase domain-containing protein n=1 Tax=Saccharopolyspora taberi TaxID=60895 RepID=A0ABN3VKE6_9PSEU
MPSDDLPVEVGRSVKLFLTALDELAPGLVTGFYLVGSVALGDFHPRGGGRGRLSTASDIDFVAVTDRRAERESREMAALAEAHARTLARFPRPHFDGAVLTWTDLAAGPEGCPEGVARCADISTMHQWSESRRRHSTAGTLP